jgi:hypothetical protein
MPVPAHVDVESEPDVRLRSRPERRGLRVLGFGCAVLAVLVYVGWIIVGAVTLFSESDHVPDRDSVLKFAGFGSVEGLEVGDLRRESWLDEAVDFNLEGPTAAIDRAFEEAEFEAQMEAGLQVQVPAGLRLDAFVNMRSAEDVYVNSQGQRVYRHIVRGESAQSPGVELVHVMAFTT